jgi:Uma2 family endonuclease
MDKGTLLPSPRADNGRPRGQTIVRDGDVVRIPAWVTDHASFRRWVHSDEFPERAGRVCYLDGEVWVDLSKEQLFTHNQVKAEFARVLGTLVKEERLGRFFPDGALVSNAEAGLTAQPDGAFVSRRSLESGRVRPVEGAKEGYVELEGRLDMVLEVVSDSSVEKDTEVLPELYWRAAVREYWLVDARGVLSFDILRHTAKGYARTRRQAGWLRSAVFGRALRLRQQADELGNPEYSLDSR